MKIPRVAQFILLISVLLLVACSETAPTETTQNPVVPTEPAAAIPATLAAQETPFASPPTPAPTRVAAEAYCKNGGALEVAPNEKLAATVNGQPIPLAIYEREAKQKQDTLIAGGAVDPKTQQGKEALKGEQRQALGELIDNVLIEQAAKAENVAVTAQDVNNRIQQLIDEAGGREKFDNYLKSTQMTLDEYSMQIRASAFGEVMLNRVTAALPTKVEQVHVAHILLDNQADANKVLAELKAGKDFAALAKQYSKDTETSENGGDIGWFPKGMRDQAFEAAAFQLKPGQVSGVVATPFGFEIIKVFAYDPARELSPDYQLALKQQAFYAWLDAQRNKAKIEKFVNP